MFYLLLIATFFSGCKSAANSESNVESSNTIPVPGFNDFVKCYDNRVPFGDPEIRRVCPVAKDFGSDYVGFVVVAKDWSKTYLTVTGSQKGRCKGRDCDMDYVVAIADEHFNANDARGGKISISFSLDPPQIRGVTPRGKAIDALMRAF